MFVAHELSRPMGASFELDDDGARRGTLLSQVSGSKWVG